MPNSVSQKIIFLLSLLIMSGASNAAEGEEAASFDCSSAQSHVEKLICDSPEAGQFDQEMNNLYSQHPARKEAWFVRLQRDWLKERDQCADISCIVRAYDARIETIRMFRDIDWDMTYYGLNPLLDIARDEKSILRGQEAWRKTLDKCRDTACVENAYRDRRVVLDALKNTAPRARMKVYRNKTTGLEFKYLENRWIAPCSAGSEDTCMQLMSKWMGYGSPFLLEIRVENGSLEQMAGSLWERRGDKWIAFGRGQAEAEVETVHGSWKGLKAETVCGIGDQNGFHGAAGTCTTYLTSNGKRSAIVTDDGVSGRDPASEATINSIRFVP